jgi:hypothetical protein
MTGNTYIFNGVSRSIVENVLTYRKTLGCSTDLRLLLAFFITTTSSSRSSRIKKKKN